MWNREQSKTPVMSLRTPAMGAEVLPLIEKFDAISTELANALAQIRSLDEILPLAVKADMEADANAILTGKKAKATAQQENRAQHEALTRGIPALKLACDRAGNELAKAIGNPSDEWVERMKGNRDECADRLAETLELAKEQAVGFGLMVSAIAWLEEFDAGLATLGKQHGWHGAAYTTVKDEVEHGKHTAERLLDAVASLTRPPEPPPVFEMIGTQDAVSHG